jgi:YCII-related domain-containing protein
MEPITDEEMRARLAKSKTYSLVLLKRTEKRGEPGADSIVWEHGRRNMQLVQQGVLRIVCPVTDDSGWSGIGVFDATPEEVTEIMAGDPGVRAGLFSYEVHPVRGFPGSTL